MTFASIILLVSNLSFFNPDVHDFHVSKCLIEFNQDETALQMSLYIFIDDLEEGLRQKGYDRLFICTKQEATEANDLINEYLRQHLQLTVNGKEESFEFIGKEISDDLSAVWCYLEITKVQELKTLEIKNDILCSVFDDQKNIVSVIGPKHKATMLFQKGQEIKEATF